MDESVSIVARYDSMCYWLERINVNWLILYLANTKLLFMLKEGYQVNALSNIYNTIVILSKIIDYFKLRINSRYGSNHFGICITPSILIPITIP